MPLPRQDSEPPMVVASRWVSQITSIALQMALPAGLGAWLDRRWGTSPWLVVVGAGFGLLAAGASLMQIVQRQKSSVQSTPTNQLPEPRNFERPDEPGSSQ